MNVADIADIVTYPGTAHLGHHRHTPAEPEDSAMKIAERSMLFPESVRFRAEEGFSGAIIQAARQQRITTSEFVRRALREKLAAEGVALPPLDAAGQRQAA